MSANGNQTVNSVGELDINFQTVFKIASGLVNINQFRPGLQTLSLTINELNNCNDLKDIVNACSTTNINLMDTTLPISEANGVLTAVEHLQEIGNILIQFMRDTSGLDEEVALGWLSSIFDAEPGWSRGEILDSFANAFNIAGLFALGLLTGGVAIPLWATRILIWGGLATRGGELVSELAADNITETQFAVGLFSELIVTGLSGGAGRSILNRHPRLEGRIRDWSENNIASFDSWTSFGADTFLGNLAEHESALESLSAVISQETGIPPADVKQSIRSYFASLAIQNRRTAAIRSEYSFDINPDITRPFPTYQGNPGPLNLPIEIVAPTQGSSSVESFTYTQVGEYSNRELENLLNQYPDFKAWWNVRANEYYQNPRQNEAGNELSFVGAILDGQGIWDVTNVPVPRHYEQLTFAYIRYLQQGGRNLQGYN